MTIVEKKVNRKLGILNHAIQSGNIAKTCLYFGIPRSLFYVWRNAYRELGDEGLNGRNLYPELTPIKHRMKSSKRFYVSGENII